MENSNFIIRIPEPCHEDWNKMEPDAKGKFCGSCNKSVFDFSNKTDPEIHDILIQYKDQKVCGHFKKTQVNRPLNFRINFNDLPKNISSTKSFAIALFLVFGTMLFSCTNLDGKKVDTIEVVNSREEVYTVGMMIVEPPLEKIALMDTLKIEAVTEHSECHYETHVAGGLSYDEVIVKEELPIKKDSIVLEEFTDRRVMGLMEYIPEEKDSTLTALDAVDSAAIKTSEKLNPFVINKQTELSIYPNPSNGEFTIKYNVLKRADIRVDIFDLKGALLKTVVNVNGQFEGKYQVPVNLSGLPAGIYLVTIINNGKRFTEKLVIE